MQFKLIPLLACVATQAYAATWTLQGYSKNDGTDTSCSAGTLGIDEIINQSGSGPVQCAATSGSTSIQSINWSSGGSADAQDSFFLCFYNDASCSSDTSLATFPEGDTGCTVTPNLRSAGGFRHSLFYSVKASGDGGC